MANLDFYISRKSTEKFLNNLGQALKQPTAHCLLFYVYGIGGIGKSTLLEKVREMHADESKFARAFFGPTSKVDSPLTLMENLYKQLPNEEWGGDKFTELCQQYKETLHKLETEPTEGKGSASNEQISLVKKLLGSATKTIASWLNVPEPTAQQLGSATEGVVDAASLILSEKDRIEQLLKKHQATKNKRELQELMLDPLPKLTQAFVEGIIQKSKSHPIVLELDTYEKASSDFDVFICKYLLGDMVLHSHPIRIVMAGRYSLKNKRYQRIFQQHQKLIYECHLERFSDDETKQYLREAGIVQPLEVNRIAQATKGFPYFLELIKTQREDGISLNILRDSDEIANLLLDGLTPTQKQVVQLASYCRWFDRSLIHYLVKKVSLINQNQPIEEQVDWFDWLIERDFVVAEDTYRIDDVARDMIRAAEHRADEQSFRHIHDLLAQYFQQLADQEIAPNQSIPAKYENSDWRKYSAEVTYHTLFANRDRGQFQLLTYFFEGAYFKQPDIAITAFTAVTAESEPTNNELLPKDTQRFLDGIQFAIELGWQVVDDNPDQYEFQLEISGSSERLKATSIKSKIESELKNCFQKVTRLAGLAKYVGLMSQAIRCHPDQRLALVQQARQEAEKIITLDHPEFTSGLLLNIASGFKNIGLKKEAINNYDEVIKFTPKNFIAWQHKGALLLELDLYEEALDNIERAIQLDPNYFGSWGNRGLALGNLERYEEAVRSFKKAIDLNPEHYGNWFNQGTALAEIERYDAALESYDKAISLKPDDHDIWISRGDTLRRLRRYEEALTSVDQSLKIRQDVEAWNLKGLCLSYLKHYDEALNNIKKAESLEKKEPLYVANQGIVLARSGRYEEAFSLCEKALKLKEDESGYYAKACCHSLQGHNDLAIEALQKAIQFNPHKCCLEAKCNPDFDHLRYDPRFQALITS